MGLRSLMKGHSSKAEEAEQERADASSSRDAPPPYMPSNDDEQAPDYERPLYAHAGSAMAKMPPSFNIYTSWKSMTKFHLGPSRDEKLFAVTSYWGWGLFTKKPPIIIHDGPSNSDPHLAVVGPVKANTTQDCTITLPARPGSSLPPLEVKAGYVFESWRQWHYTFTMRVPSRGLDADGREMAPQEETFAWRTSTGDEVRAQNDGSRMSSGWKLVWVTGPEMGEGGKRKEREAGFASDGREVVAVAAHNSKGWSMTKPLRFSFMGTGLTGTLGEQWELMVVASALELWWMYQMSVAAANASAAASSG